MRERNIRFQLRLSEKENELLRRQSSRCGLSRQAYLIALLNKTPVREQPKIEFHAIMRELQQIGVNMNQIALKANSLNIIDAAAYRNNVLRLQKVTAELVRGVYS